MTEPVQPVALHEAARRRYLAYAMSVITARALPDVRDGLKPVQRRILYAMRINLRLGPDARHRKSAAVVGEVMARYHPHGDTAIYEAMVRMAQTFSLLHPLVDGQGNFGSMDGDPPAAMRYTEARLTALALELIDELGKQTVHFRPTYDGQGSEPVVLPARFPQLLVNGAEGIAVGMATRIPPHNLGEIVRACMRLIDDPTLSVAELCRTVRAPDFPTGGLLLADRDALRELYETGSGSFTVRGTYVAEKRGRKACAVITSLPYAQNKATLVERIGAAISERKVPQLVDVRDESAEDVRVVLELRREEDLEPAMAWLFKHTPLQQRVHANLTCLVPTENPEVAAPARLDLGTMLRHWNDFRFQTVRRRLEYDLRKLLERIHILRAFELLFDALDEAIQLIRTSEGKRHAAERLMDRFDLDEVQTDAILELRLYRLAKLEILAIRQELAECRAEASRIETILASDAALWDVVKAELEEVLKTYAQPRRTQLAGQEAVGIAYSEEDYIVAEDTFVVVTRDGWFKRQTSFTELERIRIREGDAVGWLIKASTRSTVTLFTNRGSAYTLLVDDVPATTGYGEPLQARFAFSAGERVVGVVSHDARNLPVVSDEVARAVAAEGEEGEEPVPGPWGVAVTRRGRGLRFPLASHAAPSTRAGRLYLRPQDDEDGVVACWPSDGAGYACMASVGGNALSWPVSELRASKGAGKGMLAIKLADEDTVLAFGLGATPQEGVTVLTERGREEVVKHSRFAGARGARGKAVLRRSTFERWVLDPVLQLGPAQGEA